MVKVEGGRQRWGVSSGARLRGERRRGWFAPGRWRGMPAMLTGGSVILTCSCGGDARLAGKNIPHVEVRSVTHYGVVLDEQASPEQVAYVALRAIREDFEARDKQAREAARAIQFDVCAADELADRGNPRLTRDENVYRVVDRWTPTVSHYTANFESDWEKAKAKLVRRDVSKPAGKSSTERTELAMQVEDPSGDARARAVMLIWLAKDRGFWRVTHFGFDNTTRTLRGTSG